MGPGHFFLERYSIVGPFFRGECLGNFFRRGEGGYAEWGKSMTQQGPSIVVNKMLKQDRLNIFTKSRIPAPRIGKVDVTDERYIYMKFELKSIVDHD